MASSHCPGWGVASWDAHCKVEKENRICKMAMHKELPDFLKEASPELMLEHLVCFDPDRPDVTSHLVAVPFDRLPERVNDQNIEPSEYLWSLESISSHTLQAICSRLGFKVGQFDMWEGGRIRANFENAIQQNEGSKPFRLEDYLNPPLKVAAIAVEVVESPPILVQAVMPEFVNEPPAVAAKRPLDDAFLQAKSKVKKARASIVRFDQKLQESMKYR
jgi:hypothetical protein